MSVSVRMLWAPLVLAPSSEEFVRLLHLFCRGRLPAAVFQRWMAGSGLNSGMSGEDSLILMMAVTASSDSPFLQSLLMIFSREPSFTLRGMGWQRKQQVHHHEKVFGRLAKLNIYFSPCCGGLSSRLLIDNNKSRK